MDSLPLEILQSIFALACTDGGRTGCSLALTSVSVRAAARIARFHSVSLVAYPARLEPFVALYTRECAPALGDRPRIAHLHLTVPPDSLSLLDPEPAPTRKGPTPVEYTASYKTAARTLTRLVAADVETLALQYGFRAADVAGGSWLDFIDRPLPRLRALSVLGLLDLAPLLAPELSSSPPTQTQTQTPTPLFPALTHLHIVRRDPELLRTGHLAFWRAHAPRATHVRIALLPAHHPHTLRALADALGVPVPLPYNGNVGVGGQGYAPRLAWWRSVRRLVLQRADTDAEAPALSASQAVDAPRQSVDFDFASPSPSTAQAWCTDDTRARAAGVGGAGAPGTGLDEGLRCFRDAASGARAGGSSSRSLWPSLVAGWTTTGGGRGFGRGGWRACVGRRPGVGRL
ncbi:hypothetical protein C8Q78DRAFT_1082863 [Trametes maxima]|nr:hypothetical protein C8Q78DRAFT_1082863 [Trametes maxima]